ncbi:COG1361 S-layer family protein [Halobacteriaceae archaeon GCM10025711]
MFFGGLERRQEATNVYFDRLAPGETRTFAVSAGADDDTTNGSYPVNLVVNYKNDNEIDEQSDVLQPGIDVGHEQTFAIRDTSSTLRVGDDGDVTGTLVNTGRTTVTNAVLVYQPENKNLHPRETEYALGTLGPGESADFAFRLDASSEADPGPRVLPYQVRYRNLDDEVRKSDTIDIQVDVGPETDEFDLRPVNAEVVAGAGSTVTIEVTNTADQTLTDVEAKLFTDDPLTSDDDEAFIERLEPGESAEIKFSIGAAGTALAKTYPVSLDFSYEDERGDTELSDTYRVPVRVTEAESSGPPFTLIGIGGVAVFGVLVWWKRDAFTGRLR